MRRRSLFALTQRTLRPAIAAVRSHDLVSRRLLLGVLARLSTMAAVVGAAGPAFAARRTANRDAHAERTIAVLVDRMLPADDLPGGLALGIDRRIVATPDAALKRSLGRAVAWLDLRARRRGGRDFIGLDAPGQDAVLQEALVSEAEEAGIIGGPLRTQAFTLYYTHPTVMAAFAYAGPPQPEGFPDFQDAPR